jgi:hypothetical protein
MKTWRRNHRYRNRLPNNSKQQPMTMRILTSTITREFMLMMTQARSTSVQKQALISNLLTSARGSTKLLRRESHLRSNSTGSLCSKMALVVP